MLSESERQLYDRQLAIDGWNEEVQLQLKNSRVLVAGAGGLGSPVIFYLAAAGLGDITICDYDRVSESNLNRQIIHGTGSIGNMKVESACERVRSLNPNVLVHTSHDYIDTGNAESLIDGLDLVFDCLDNFKTRQVLNRAAVKKSVPLVHGGIEGFNGQIAFIHPPETVCLNCFLPSKDKKDRIPVLGATAGLVGSLQAMEGIKFLTGIGENLKDKILFVDAMRMNFETVSISKNPKCRVCGQE